MKGAAALAVCALVAACGIEPQPLVHSASAVPLQLAAAEARSDVSPVESSPYGNFLAGLVADHEKDLPAAADFMQRALENDPENFKLLQRTLLLVAADGRHAEAVALARRLVDIDPDDNLATLMLAVDSIDQGELAAAIETLDGLPNRGLGSLMVPMLGSWLQLAGGDIDGALARIATLEQTNGMAMLHKLQVALLNDVAGRPNEAEAAYRAALESASEPSMRLVWLAGNFFERRGMTEAAKDLYLRFKEAQPGSTIFDPVLGRLAAGPRPAPAVPDYKAGIADVLFNLANLLNQQRVQDQALVQVHLALRLNPRFEVARILLGEILEGQGRDEAAVAAYRGVDPASPISWAARLRVAEGLERMTRPGEAIVELEKLAAERPEHFEPLFRVGNMLRAQERFAEAVDAYDRAFARLSEANAPHWTMLYFRGIALERSGAWQRAEHDLLAALDLEPEQPYVMNYLAYSWIEQKTNLDEAKEMLIKAVELKPNDGFIVDSLGWVFYRLGEYDEAARYLERAVELRPQDSVINDHLGDAYWRVGRRQEARFQWRRALSLKPEANIVPTIEAKIDRGLGVKPEKI